MNNAKGIIFDMDNTLLRSRIDFPAMKQETYQFLVSREIVSADLILSNYTTSTLIEEAMNTRKMTEQLMTEMWEIPKKHELEGMVGADLEPGVISLLDKLHGRYRMVIVTNNTNAAAETALKDNEIYAYFDLVIGRETMGSLKPAPDGFLYILEKFPKIAASDWLSVGDAWIDGKASALAGIRFLSYQGDIEKMNKMGVYPEANIMNISDLLDYL